MSYEEDLIMNYRIIDDQEGTVDIGASLSGSAVEAMATRYATDLASERIVHDHAFMRTNAFLLAGLPSFDEIMMLSLQDAADRVVYAASSEMGFIPLDDPLVRLLEGDLSTELHVLLTIPVAKERFKVSSDELVVRYHPVIESGEELEERIREACEQYLVSTEEELIEKTGLYESVNEMRRALRRSLEEYVVGLNARSKKDAICTALLEKNPIEVPASMLDQYVDRELRGLIRTMGSDAFHEQLQAQGMTEDAFRSDIAENLEDVLLLEIILDALVLASPHDVTDEERSSMIEARIAQDGTIDAASRAEACETILKDIKTVPSRLRSIDKEFRRKAMLESILESARMTALAPMTSEEFVRIGSASMPRFE